MPKQEDLYQLLQVHPSADADGIEAAPPKGEGDSPEPGEEAPLRTIFVGGWGLMLLLVSLSAALAGLYAQSQERKMRGK